MPIRSDTAQDSAALRIFAPSIPSPEACIGRTGEARGVSLPILHRLDLRLHPGEAKPGTIGQAQVSGWVQVQFKTQEMTDGKMIESGLLWDSEGNLIAQSRQLAMLLKRG